MSATVRPIVTTGASSGFGTPALRPFADRGDRVWGAMRDAEGHNAGLVTKTHTLEWTKTR